MKKLSAFLTAVLLFSISLTAQDQSVKKWLVSGAPVVDKPVFISGNDVEEKEFETKLLLTQRYLDLVTVRPAAEEIFPWQGSVRYHWKKLSSDEEGFLNIRYSGKKSNHVVYLASYIESSGLNNIRIEVESPQMFEVYIDGDKVSSNYTADDDGKLVKRTGSKELEAGKYIIIIKSVCLANSEADWKIKAVLKDTCTGNIALSVDRQEKMTIHHLLEGEKLRSLRLSPDGSLVNVTYSEISMKTEKTQSWSVIKKSATGKILQSFRKEKTTGYSWAPTGNKLYHTESGNNGSSVWVYDFDNKKEYKLISNVEEMSGFRWAPDGSFIIYNVIDKKKKNGKSSLLYMDRLGNRTFRPESINSLYKYDIESGITERLTFGDPGVSLNDISEDGRFILFSTSRPNPTQRPFTLQNMYLLDLNKDDVRELWKDFRWSGRGQFSPNGKKILVAGGPDLFGETGRNIGDNPIANNYDGQLYIYDISSGSVDPITRDFDPAVGSATWHTAYNRIYISASDRVYKSVFSYDIKTKKFTNIPVEPDVVGRFDIASGSLKAAYTGTSNNVYPKGWLFDLTTGESTLFENPEAAGYSDVIFGSCEDWNYKMPDGKEIAGYIIFPADFDPAKKYPLIVNYYGGTSPIEKSFGGRYPHEIWSANGYLVYVPQPSGATGFGQEFSSRHQNNWGITVADEIIEGTKQFLAAHSYADEDHVGCIGASYGGFMTMLLTTRTDMFTCAISHAGISSISSYWGEGYWGYAYSSEATGDAYPWNRKDIYIDQSPLFSADKIHTPLLLLHGASDTNVPLGESLQLWVGLKILGRPVEMVQVEGENHHILSYTKRIEWHNSIMSWFDKWLKEKPEDWSKMFPKSEL
ncbi:MAG: prolyl oligopeptidase family serine peptidase [Bacteroidales bacterium]|nr:prolyl oligopeptidase family serine peptidase [Bacteroidales bacterium]